jgi:hypothetical protein
MWTQALENGDIMPQEPGQETFTVSITGSGVEFKREVDANRLALILTVVMGGELYDPSISSRVNIHMRAEPAKISLREFLNEVKATTKPDQIVAIGQYMASHEGKETFSRDEIKSRFQSAREPLPANFPRDFGAAIGKGMIAEDHAAAGQYYVTKTGAEVVSRQFGAKG